MTLAFFWQRKERRWPVGSFSYPKPEAPQISAQAVTVVVPVRDNQSGFQRLVRSFEKSATPERPREIIAVDNGSVPRLRLDANGVRVLECEIPGPAAARNVGWRAARTPWVLFMDSDCIAGPGLLKGFAGASNGAIAYAGNVKALARGAVSRYYDAQKTLVPPPDHEHRPEYLVTANALVLRHALETVQGFDESFQGAGGEDIDLAIRLRAVGQLSYAPHAHVLHDFEESLASFVRRFVRYGRGSRQLERLHGVPQAPELFWPADPSATGFGLAALQVASMFWGYMNA